MWKLFVERSKDLNTLLERAVLEEERNRKKMAHHTGCVVGYVFMGQSSCVHIFVVASFYCLVIAYEARSLARPV